MHNAAFEALAMDAVYLAFDIQPAQLQTALEGARAMDIQQLAISIPHKESVMALLDEIDPIAKRIGAVNTVTRTTQGQLCGSNTDWLGAQQALETHTSLAGKQAVVLGAGGTARALTYALNASGATVSILNRSIERAQELATRFEVKQTGTLADFPNLTCDILINTTSVGLNSTESPIDPSTIQADCVVMDAVYEPEETQLLRAAKQRGAKTISGKWMLIYQAAAQLTAWTGRKAPIDVMGRCL